MKHTSNQFNIFCDYIVCVDSQGIFSIFDNSESDISAWICWSLLFLMFFSLCTPWLSKFSAELANKPWRKVSKYSWMGCFLVLQPGTSVSLCIEVAYTHTDTHNSHSPKAFMYVPHARVALYMMLAVVYSLCWTRYLSLVTCSTTLPYSKAISWLILPLQLTQPAGHIHLYIRTGRWFSFLHNNHCIASSISSFYIIA